MKQILASQVIADYLAWELFKLTNYQISLAKLDAIVASYSPRLALRALEAFSGAMNITGVYSELTDISYDWFLTKLPASQLSTSPMYGAVEHIVRRSNYNLQKIADEAKNNSDAFYANKKFFELKKYKPAIAVEYETKILIIDGHHRALREAMQAKNVTVYLAKKTDRKELKNTPEFPIHYLQSVYKSAQRAKEPEVTESVLKILAFLKQKDKYANLGEILKNTFDRDKGL